jgi:hypothetical protein
MKYILLTLIYQATQTISTNYVSSYREISYDEDEVT